MNLAGSVIAGMEPVVTLRILDDSGESWEIDAVVDTGFTGTLMLPASAIEAMNLPWIGDSVGSVVDSEAVPFDIYRARVIWLDGPMETEIIELGEFALIGMTLLQDTRLTIDITDGGIVQIAPLPPASSDD